MLEPPIPYPNNELGPPIPPPTGSYRIEVDFATSASYAETASYTLGFIVSASYANFASTASYLLGSIANAVSASWANFSGHSNTSDTASWSINTKSALSASWASQSIWASTASYFGGTAPFAITASYALRSETSSYSDFTLQSVSSSYALTASYSLNGGGTSISSSYLSGSSATVNKITLENSTLKSYITSKITSGIVAATPVDDFPDTDGNSAKWLISINDGSSFKTSEVIAIWEPISNITNFAEVTTNTIGSIPVAMSVNISGNQVRLIANPASGSWTVKTIRFVL